MLRWLVVLISCAVVFGSHEDLFCKDPDTNEYHAVNSTWSSTTFCGNYTCKLRRKANATTEFIPRNDKVTREAQTNKLLGKIKDIVVEEKQVNSTDDHCEECNEIPTNDRYLNTEEVNSISKFLYSVKKSDLDTLLEVYKLVNELYGEMDTSATEDTPISTAYPQPIAATNIQTYQPTFPYWLNPQYSYQGMPSLYYKPVQYYQPSSYPVTYSMHPVQYTQPTITHTKGSGEIQNQPSNKETLLTVENISQGDRVISSRTNAKNTEEMNTDASVNCPCSQLTPQTYPRATQATPVQAYSQPTPYQVTTGTNIHNFQTPVGHSNVGQPVTKETLNQALPNSHRKIPIPYSYNYTPVQPAESPKVLAATPAVPSNPIAYVPVQSQVVAVAPVNTVTIQRVSNAPTAKTACSCGSSQETVDSTINLVKDPWKTPPLNANMLDKIRAHVVRKTPNILLKPKTVPCNTVPQTIRLEKIGKVHRLQNLKRFTRSVGTENEESAVDSEVDKIEEKDSDKTNEEIITVAVKSSDKAFDVTDRSSEEVDLEEEREKVEEEIRELEKEIEELEVKASSDTHKKEENDEMETYIEISKCELDTEPGYFRAGNSSLPFPLCCPQRIQDH